MDEDEVVRLACIPRPQRAMAPNHLRPAGKHGAPDSANASHSKKPECICKLGPKLGQVCRDARECLDAPRILAWDACFRAGAARCPDEHDQQCDLCEWHGQASLPPASRALQYGATR